MLSNTSDLPSAVIGKPQFETETGGTLQPVPKDSRACFLPETRGFNFQRDTLLGMITGFAMICYVTLYLGIQDFETLNLNVCEWKS